MQQFHNMLCELQHITFPGKWVILGMRTLSQFLKFGENSTFSCCLAVQKGQKLKISDLLWYQVHRAFFCFSGLWKYFCIDSFINCYRSLYKDRMVESENAAGISLFVHLVCLPSILRRFQVSGNFCALVKPAFLGWFSYVIKVKMLEQFVWNPLKTLDKLKNTWDT